MIRIANPTNKNETTRAIYRRNSYFWKKHLHYKDAPALCARNAFEIYSEGQFTPGVEPGVRWPAYRRTQ